MKEDVRDERLGELLDAAVHGVEPPERRLLEVLRRGGRRRAARWSAIGVAVAVFVGAIGWGALSVGNRQAQPLDVATWNTYRDLQGWWARYPQGWHLQTFSGPVGHVSLRGAFFSNMDYEFRHPILGPNESTTAWDLSGLPDDAIAVDFQLFEGGGLAVSPRPDSSFPLSLEAAQPITATPGPPPGEYLYLPVNHGGQRYELYVWLGEAASQQDREIARLIVASITFGPDTSDWPKAGSMDSTGWTFAYPPEWRPQSLPACSNALARTGAVVTNTDFVFGNPQGEAPGCEGRFVFAGFPPDGVAAAIMPVGIRHGLFVPRPDTPFPISWDQLEPTGGIVGGPSESYLGVTVGGDEILSLRTWIGPEASPSAVAELRALVGSLEVQGAAHWTTYRDRANVFSMTYPDEWFRATESLTPALSEPSEILSLATYPLRPGGKACTDAYLPGNALADLGRAGIFITVQETRPKGMPTRPPSFGPESATVTWNGFPACDGYPAVPLRAWWIPFADQGRGFYAFAAVGPAFANDGQVQRLVWHVLDSLRFDPA